MVAAAGLITPSADSRPATKPPQQTRDMDAMLDQCRASGADGGPTLNQHWIHDSWTALLA